MQSCKREAHFWECEKAKPLMLLKTGTKTNKGLTIKLRILHLGDEFIGSEGDLKGKETGEGLSLRNEK